MTRRSFVLASTPFVLALAFFANISLGPGSMSPFDAIGALFHMEADSYEGAVVLYQRLPRALIAIYVGATMAVSGAVLQGLVRNPLASPSTLGMNAGATVFVVAGAYLFDFGMTAQGMAALVGALFGFFACLAVARLAGGSADPRGLALILSGALVSILFIGIANAFLLSDPARRMDFLGWVTGNINHVYGDRLYAFWWIGAAALLFLAALSRSLTLILLGHEKAASAGVKVGLVSNLAIGATVLGSGSAVAICGPIGFVGLVVPHILRPLVGSNLSALLPACMVTGASVCLLADLCARTAFHPYVLHTGVLMDLLGGLVFIIIVRRFYLSGSARGLA